jgi:hypothetical protein
MAAPPPPMPPFRRRSSAGLYLSIAGYVFFSLVGTGAFLAITRPWESEPAPPPPEPDAGPPPEPDAGPPPEPDAGPPPPEVHSYRGTLAAAPNFRFGGGPYCDYEGRLTEMELEITTTGVDAAGHPIPTGGRAAVTYDERELGNCPHEIIPPNRHEYGFASVEPAGDEVVIHFMHQSGSPPLALTFRGGYGEDVLDGTLEMRRNQPEINSRLVFQVQVAMRLTESD